MMRMGVVITVAQQKGGAGKTTLVAHLAVAWAGEGKKVAIVDIDPQASLSAWAEQRGARNGLDVSRVTGWRTQAEVERKSRDHDIVLVDSPPHAETEAKIAVRAAALVIVPVQPSPMDVWATKPTLDLAKAERVPALLVLNRVPPRARLNEAMLEKVGELGVPVAATRVGNRVALATALFEGRGITETAPSSAAGEEIRALAAEILARTKR
jgi:chromosome partitioning protein